MKYFALLAVLASSAAVVATAQLCPEQEKGFDYFGNDMKSVRGISNADCCNECAKTTGCVVYTYVEKDWDNKPSCYLKNKVGERRAKAGVVSGKPVAPPANCPKQEPNVDFVGNDLKSVRGITNTQCCDECNKLASCGAYTFVAKDWDNQSSCYLKSKAGARAAKQGVISAQVKDVPPPPPANCPTQESNVDFIGNDLKSVRGITNAQCCDECSKTSGCGAYTYVASDWDKKSSCYLKSKAGARAAKEGVVSAELKCPTSPFGKCGSSATGALCCPEGSYCQPWNPKEYQCMPKPSTDKCPTVVSGMDFYGGDIDVKYGLLLDSCCDECFKNPECHVFTFVNYNPDGRSACYLKSRLVEQRPNTGAVSGYKVKM